MRDRNGDALLNAQSPSFFFSIDFHLARKPNSGRPLWQHSAFVEVRTVVNPANSADAKTNADAKKTFMLQRRMRNTNTRLEYGSNRQNKLLTKIKELHTKTQKQKLIKKTKTNHGYV